MVPIALVQPPNADDEPPLPYALAAVLDRLRWDSDRRGVLLLVAPERTFPPSPLGDMVDRDAADGRDPFEGLPPSLLPPKLPAARPDEYSVEQLAQHFRRRLVHSGRVTTLAPIDRAAPPGWSGRESEHLDHDTPVRLLAFLGFLGPESWRAVTEPGGLGRSELTAEQARRWDDVLPDAIEFVAPPGRLAENLTLSPPQRAALRIRLVRDVWLSVSSNPPPGVTGWEAIRSRVRETLYVSSPEEPRVRARLWPDARPARVPVAPKRGDLNPGRAPVDLRGVATVGALVERIGRATRIPLFCDVRYGARTLAFRGDQAAANDLLTALCRALDATVRTVRSGSETVFLLTEERTPTAAPYGDPVRERRWAREASEALAMLARGDRWRRIPRGRGADLPDALWRAVDTDDDDFSIPLAGLPERYRVAARKAWDEQSAETRSTQLPWTRAEPFCRLRGELLWPERDAVALLGRVDASRRFTEPLAAPRPLLWPALTPLRALAVTLPRDEAGRRRLVEAAVARGVTHLFVPGESAEDVAALAAEARPAGLILVPTLAPLHGDPAEPNVPRDRSWQGGTVREWAKSPPVRRMARASPLLAHLIRLQADADYVTPEAVDAAKCAARLARLAAIPGVGAVGLRDLVPDWLWNDTRPTSTYRWRGGCTPEIRVRAIRERRFDPVDSRDDGSLHLQRERTAALFQRLDAALQRARVSVPVLAETGGILGYWLNWRADASAFMDALLQSLMQSRRAASEIVLEHLNLHRFLEIDVGASYPSQELRLSDRERYECSLRKRLGELSAQSGDVPPSCDGVAVDLSHLAPEAALAALSRLFAMQPPKRNPPLPSVVLR